MAVLLLLAHTTFTTIHWASHCMELIDIAKAGTIVNSYPSLVRLWTLLTLLEWALGTVYLVVVMAWYGCVNVSYVLVQILSGAVYRLIVNEPIRFTRRYKRCLVFMYKQLKIPYTISHVTVTLVSIVIATMVVFRGGPASLVQSAPIIFFVIFVPYTVIVFGIMWRVYLNIVRKKKWKGGRDILAQYILLSKLALKRTFKSIMSILVFVLFFFWIAIPILYDSMDRLASLGSEHFRRHTRYEEFWETIISLDGISGPLADHVVEPDSLQAHLRGDVVEMGKVFSDEVRDKYLGVMFFMITWMLFVQTSFATIVYARLYPGGRARIRNALFATVKSGLLIAVLQLVIRYGYRIEMGIFGSTSVFLLLVSFFLTWQKSAFQAGREENTDDTA